MNGAQIEALRSLYGGRDHALEAHLRRQLVDLGDGLAAQMAELERDFTPDRAEWVLHNLAGSMAHIRRLVAMNVGDHPSAKEGANAGESR